MSDNWIVYMGRVDDGNASFLVDLDADQGRDIADYPQRIELTIPFESSRNDGLPDSATLDGLHEIEDRCVESICTRLDAVHVGHAIRPGRLWSLFYAPAALNLDEAARLAVAAAGIADAVVETVTDEEWEAYFGFLFPTPAEFQWLSNRQCVDHLAQQGDSPATVRPVGHSASFASAASRDAFEKAVAELGYAIGARCETSPDEPDALPFMLEFSRAHAVDMDTITEITMPLVDLAIRNDGDYDGWKTTIAK